MFDLFEEKRESQGHNELLNYIVRHDPNAIAVYDNELRYIYVSERYLHDYGVNERDVVGRHHYDVFPEMPQKWKDVHDRVLKGAIERSDEDCFERPDGSKTWNRWECRPWYRLDGSIGGMVTYTEVITERKRTENALRESEERFSKAFRASPTALSISKIDDGQAIDVNDEWVAVMGYSREEAIGKTAGEQGYWAEINQRSVFIEHLKRDGAVRGFEATLRTKGGNIRNVVLAGDTIEINGESHLLLAFHDVTERKFRESEHELTARLLGAIDKSCGFQECMSDLIASLQDWSGCESVGIRLRDGDDYPYYETRGFPPEFVLAENQLCSYGPDGKILRDGTGNPVLECMCGNILCGRFDPAKPFFTGGGSFWTNSTTALLASASELDRLAPTRNRCNEEGYESVALIPLRAGDQVHGLLQFNDRRPARFGPGLIASLERTANNLAISLSRRQAVEALHRSEERLTLALNAAKAGNWEWDLRTNANAWSDELWRLYGLKPRSCEPSYDTWLQSVRPEDRGRVESALRAAVGCGGELNIEWRVNDPDGPERWLMSRGQPERDELGQVIRYLGIVIDVTESKTAEEEKTRLEEQLRQAQKMEVVGQLAGGVAHDFNNLLQVIVTNLELSCMKVAGDEAVLDLLESAIRAGRRGADLTQKLLVLSRKQTLRPEIVAPDRWIEGMTRLLARTLGEDIAIVTDVSEGIGTVLVDENGLTNALINLALNARAAMPRGGTLAIDLRNRRLDGQVPGENTILPAGDYVEISVTDTGCGMSEETRSRAFEPFFTTKGVGEGSGLGLSMVYGFVEQSSGSVTIESECGKGTTVQILLPVGRGNNESADTKETTEDTGKRPLRVLLVEDDDAVRAATVMLLESLGCDVKKAETAAPALAALDRDTSINVLLSDIVLPGGMNGIELAQEATRRRPGLNVILASGHAQAALEKMGLKVSGFSMLPKPFSIDDLLKAIRSCDPRGASADISKKRARPPKNEDG